MKISLSLSWDQARRSKLNYTAKKESAKLTQNGHQYAQHLTNSCLTFASHAKLQARTQ